MTIAVGGLGGGGDVGGALSLLIPLQKVTDPVVLSFLGCKERKIKYGKKLYDGILRIYPNSEKSGRFFEKYVAMLGYDVYIVCTKEDNVHNGLTNFLDDYNIDVIFSVDLGGDSLVNEPAGSFKNNILSLTILSDVSSKLEIKSFLAVGNIGLEGGGGEIEHVLVKSLKSFEKFFVGCYVPEHKEEIIGKIDFLLSYENSAMLTIYRDVLMGNYGVKEYNIMYLNKRVCIKDYHQYLFIFDAIRVGQENKLCNVVRKFGFSGLKNLKKLSRSNDNNVKLNRLCRKMAEKKLSFKHVLKVC